MAFYIVKRCFFRYFIDFETIVSTHFPTNAMYDEMKMCKD